MKVMRLQNEFTEKNLFYPLEKLVELERENGNNVNAVVLDCGLR